MPTALAADATQVRKRRLLLVDDSPLALEWLSIEFEDAGWSVRELSDGFGVLRALEGEPFDVVVCDLHMPGMTGFDITAAVARSSIDVPVVIHSSDTDVSAVLRAVRRGAFDYVIKADDPGPLLAAAERAALHAQVLRDNRRLTADLEAKVDALNEAQQELSYAYAQALQASRAKTSFLANMSHELRTPLNAILGYIEMVQEYLEVAGDPDPIDDLGKAQKAARHLHTLIGEVLDLSAIEAGKLQLHPEPIGVRWALHDVSELVAPLAARRGNRVVVDDPGRLDVFADPQKLRQVLINLAGNAAKFTDHGEIRLRATVEGDAVRFDVVDTGVGMTPDQLSRVFDAFEQATSKTKFTHGGTGLGLSISRALVREMGGELSATSTLGQGTCMTFTLPRSDP